VVLGRVDLDLAAAVAPPPSRASFATWRPSRAKTSPPDDDEAVVTTIRVANDCGVDVRLGEDLVGDDGRPASVSELLRLVPDR